MKISEEEVKKILSDPDKIKVARLLRYAFSFKENINIFVKVFFSHIATNKTPDFHDEIYSFLFSKGNGALAAPRGHSKQLSDDTPILTKNGWKKHGDLNVGDYVFSPSGKQIKILAKNKKTSSDYLVKTRDGEIIRCAGEHEWTVWDRNKKKEVTVETKNMVVNGERSRYLLPLREALEFEDKELLLDPYFLGLWLGDGSEGKQCITHSREDFDSINYIPYNISAQWTHKDTGVITTNFGNQGIVKHLKELNIYNNKHIPEIYLQSSIKQRLELMAGLIDSDGHVSKKRGRVRFTNVNYRLIKDVEKLAISLGSRPYITTNPAGERDFPLGRYKTKKSYTLCFDPIMNIPTKLKRKRSKRISDRQRLGITSVSYEPNGEVGNCIEVDSDDGLYLAGKRLIPTHNSSVTGIFYLIYCVVNRLERYIVYVSQNHSKTVQFIDPIREEFKNNELIRLVYGDLTPSKNKDEFGKDREDCFDVGGCRVEAVSFEKNLRGFKYKNIRPTLIIGDDIESDERVLNPDLRVKDANKLNKVIIPSLDISGRFKMIGTILHVDSLLVKKIKLWKGKIFKACDEDLTNILWEERFTRKVLQKIRHDIGSVSFAQEYLNNPIDNTSSLIKREWVESCFREDLSADDVYSMEFEVKTLGVDFAFSDRVTADDSAFVGLAKKDDFLYLIGSRKEKGLSVNEQMKIIKDELYEKNQYDQIGLEENSIKAISKDISQWGLPITLFWTASADPAARLKPGYDWSNKRHTVGKINLIMRLGTAFENKRFIIPYKTDDDKARADRILAESTSFALSDGKLVEAGIHPDIPIAMGYALELINNTAVVMDFG